MLDCAQSLPAVDDRRRSLLLVHRRTSSTNIGQKPLASRCVAFLMTVIFIANLLVLALATSCASEMSADSKLRL